MAKAIWKVENGSHLNDSAPFGECEMMGRFIVTETHHMVSPIIQHGIAVLVRPRRRGPFLGHVRR